MDDSSKQNDSWKSALRLGNHSFFTAFLLAVLAVVLSLAVMGPLTFALGVGIGAPLVVVLLLFSALLIFKKIFLRDLDKNLPGDSDAALLEYLQQAGGAHHDEEVAAELLENALHLKQVRAQNCMAPRPEIVHVDAEASVDALRQQFVESRLSRILITEGDLDRVLGYVHVQQLFKHPQRVRDMVMPINFVPESIPVNDLLYKFIRTRTTLAAVVDEYGSLAGLVTMEDALEQLFGEIDDEHDEAEFIETRVEEGEYLFSGRLEIEYLNEKYPELSLPAGNYNTLSGYLVTTTHTIPEQGVVLELDGKKFVLELVSDRKIETVRVFV